MNGICLKKRGRGGDGPHELGPSDSNFSKDFTSTSKYEPRYELR